jgi:hypothetical protein
MLLLWDGSISPKLPYVASKKEMASTGPHNLQQKEYDISLEKYNPLKKRNLAPQICVLY